MKFLYINNELCEDCDKCTSACPTSAIFRNEGKRYIDYDKCVSCGTCFRECAPGAISIEKIEKLSSEIDNLNRYKMQIIELERENARLTEENNRGRLNIKNLIQKLPVATVVSDKNGKILYYNAAFTEFLDMDAREIADSRHGLTDQDLSTITPHNIVEMFMGAAAGDDLTGRVTSFNEHKATVSVYNIRKGEMLLGIFRNLHSAYIAKEEITLRIREAIDRKMALVQKIGFLLGEETSEISKNLNSIVELLDQEK